MAREREENTKHIWGGANRRNTKEGNRRKYHNGGECFEREYQGSWSRGAAIEYYDVSSMCTHFYVQLSSVSNRCWSPIHDAVGLIEAEQSAKPRLVEFGAVAIFELFGTRALHQFVHAHLGDCVVVNEGGENDKCVEELVRLELNSYRLDQVQNKIETYPYVTFSREASFGNTRGIECGASDVHGTHDKHPMDLRLIDHVVDSIDNQQMECWHHS